MIYGHRKEGVSFVRYRRPLKSDDKKYDLPVNYADNMTVIWSQWPVHPPDSLRQYYLPQDHGQLLGICCLIFRSMSMIAQGLWMQKIRKIKI